MDFSSEIEAAINSPGDINQADYRRWVEQGDLASRARVYALALSHWSRIQPAPQVSEYWAFATDYLLETLVADSQGELDYIHSGFEAAHELAAWLKHIVKEPEGEAVVADVAHRLAAAYRASDQTTRNRIETGALEHALESRRVRPFFDAWAADPVLREAYEPALQWGLAHAEID